MEILVERLQEAFANLACALVDLERGVPGAEQKSEEWGAQSRILVSELLTDLMNDSGLTDEELDDSGFGDIIAAMWIRAEADAQHHC